MAMSIQILFNKFNIKILMLTGKTYGGILKLNQYAALRRLNNVMNEIEAFLWQIVS